MRQRAPVALLVLILPLARSPAQSLEFSLRAATGVAVAWDERFAPGWQLAVTGGARLQILGGRFVGGGIGVAYDGALPSPVSKLVSYRGYGGIALELFAAGSFPLRGPVGGSTRDPLEGGSGSVDLRAGLRASVLSYVPAPIYFVVPAVFVEPGFSLPFRRLPSVSFGVSAPLVLSRRADLRFAASMSLAVGIAAKVERGRRR